MKYRLFLIAILFISMQGCDKNNTSQKFSARDSLLISEIIEFRREKDAFFKNDASSPLPEEERATFNGLNYYPVSTDYAFKLRLNLYSESKTDTIYGTKGDARPSVKYGFFDFVTDSGNFRLDVYKIFSGSTDTTGYLFLGFTDKTTGTETYGAGRYVEPEPLDNKGEYLIDFNKAYNPYCAYNHRYSCAIPPIQNRIPFKLRAGEKNYKSSH